MKHLKKNAQKNVYLDTDYYNEHELKKYKQYGFIYDPLNRDVYLIFLEKGDEISVSLDPYGYYTTILKNKVGTWYIKL